MGELEDLPTAPDDNHLRGVDENQPPPSDTELLEAAEVAIKGMQELIGRQRRRAAKRYIDIPSQLGTAAAPRGLSTDPVAAAVAQIAALCRSAIELRRRLKG